MWRIKMLTAQFGSNRTLVELRVWDLCSLLP